MAPQGILRSGMLQGILRGMLHGKHALLHSLPTPKHRCMWERGPFRPLSQSRNSSEPQSSQPLKRAAFCSPRNATRNASRSTEYCTKGTRYRRSLHPSHPRAYPVSHRLPHTCGNYTSYHTFRLCTLREGWMGRAIDNKRVM